MERLEPSSIVGGCDGSFYVSTWVGPGMPDIWLNIISGVSVRVFPEEMNI